MVLNSLTSVPIGKVVVSGIQSFVELRLRVGEVKPGVYVVVGLRVVAESD